MNALIRWTFPLIAYLCVGTVISAALGYGYLRHSGKLDDETMFRIMALVHGVDLDELAKEGTPTVEETPPEEPSFAEQQQRCKRRRCDSTRSRSSSRTRSTTSTTSCKQRDRRARALRPIADASGKLSSNQQQEDLPNRIWRTCARSSKR